MTNALGQEATRPFSWSRAAVSALLLGVGCSNVIGLSGSEKHVDCVTDQDCAAGERCVDHSCSCVEDCAGSGAIGAGATSGAPDMSAGDTAGRGGTDAGGSGADSPQGGSKGGHASGGKGGSGAEGGSSARGGSSPNGGTKNAQGGTSEPSGSGGMLVQVAGEGGAGEGGVSGRATSSGGEGGGEGGHDSGQQCPSCFECDDTGASIDGKASCDQACHAPGICDFPRSCEGMTDACDGKSCCLSVPVGGGTFNQSCDDTCNYACYENGGYPTLPATLTPYTIDAFEVTVGRFRRFFDQYNAAKPAVGSGKNPRNADDNGWQSDWSSFLPTDSNALSAALKTCDSPLMWTDDGQAGAQIDHENRPMNCVTWYEAQAFCIWDGGRLPTEAEWNFVAAGGAENRPFPWSQSEDDFSIDSDHAAYWSGTGQPTEPADVGTHSAGNGRWAQEDLAGNVGEWTWSAYLTCYELTPGCNDCGTTNGYAEKAVRGGSYQDVDIAVLGQARLSTDAATRSPATGFRCARDL
jgi:formylglycine-generating enzyme required for sulfatase activity